MANIRIDVPHTITDGSEVSFTAPCNCTEISGIKVYHAGGSKVFTFKDSHGNTLTGIGNLFSAGAIVKALLDVKNGFAFLQNADTNKYLEDMFAGKAPAGFGLGVAGSNSVSSVQNINKNGWWLANGDTPDGGYWFCLPRMVNSGNNMVVDAWSLNGLSNAKISKGADGFGAWEWVNPPMALEVEYRTTERLHNLPVYAKLVDFGSGPNNTTKSVAHGISNIKNIAEWHCYNLNGGTSLDQSTTVTAITVNNTNINVTTSANEAAWHMRFIIKYTKTTD